MNKDPRYLLTKIQATRLLFCSRNNLQITNKQILATVENISLEKASVTCLHLGINPSGYNTEENNSQSKKGYNKWDIA